VVLLTIRKIPPGLIGAKPCILSSAELQLRHKASHPNNHTQAATMTSHAAGHHGKTPAAVVRLLLEPLAPGGLVEGV
jgi:hypothetical protein